MKIIGLIFSLLILTSHGLSAQSNEENMWSFSLGQFDINDTVDSSEIRFEYLYANNFLKNNYDLSGVGISFSIPIYKNFALTATYAEKLGNNPGKDSNGNDVDGLTWDNRSLISLVGQF